MFNNYVYQKAEKVFWHDRLLQRFFLPLIPKYFTPNHITIFRFFLTPFVVWLLVNDNFKAGLILFLLTAFTDVLDGSLARIRNQITDIGKILDPLADKLLITSVLIIIILKGLNFYLALIIIMVEVLFVLGALWRKIQHKVVEANLWGKIKMNLQVIGVS